MPDAAPVLQLLSAEPARGAADLPPIPLTLELLPGDLALIEVRSPAWAAEFADLCSGLTKLARGSVRFLGRDWASLPEMQASALRGRIGRVPGAGAWIGFAGTDLNILLPQLHHTRRPLEPLRDAAADLARAFGLPGLPLVRPDALAPADLARAACVRALLGEPRLVLLESPEQGQFADLVPPLLNALAAARDRGAAAIWLTDSDLVWNDRSFPATLRLRFSERGLARLRYAA
ncbi:MAG TPA: ABC transporter ATP-binding protein [Acetobacteraceae bacterium]|nr:ABC transporter ATP-binding protein [Acetobacteraceae bacterium]